MGLLRILTGKPTLKYFRHGKLVRLRLRVSGRGQSLTGLERVLFGVLIGGCTSGIAEAKSQLGVARATRGVPVLVCNVASNFTLEGYRYGNKTDV